MLVPEIVTPLGTMVTQSEASAGCNSPVSVPHNQPAVRDSVTAPRSYTLQQSNGGDRVGRGEDISIEGANPSAEGNPTFEGITPRSSLTPSLLGMSR